MSNGAMAHVAAGLAPRLYVEGRGKREEGGGRRGAGRRRTWRAADGVWRDGVCSVWARFRFWRLAALARWRLGDFVSAAPGRDA
jgi:hypothetical protein